MRTDSETAEFVEEYLEHFGVKGMRWGQRMSEFRANRATKKAARKERRAVRREERRKRFEAHMDKRFEEKASDFDTKIELHNRAGDIMDSKGDIDRINAKSEYIRAAEHGVLLKEDHPVTQKYNKEYMDTYVQRLNEAAKEMGTNWSGTREYTVKEAPEFLGFSVQVKDVEHANDPGSFKVKFVKDEEGFITDLEIISDAMAQAAIFLSNHLEHFGVKGMRWGRTTKGPTSASVTQKGKKLKTKGGERQPAHPDAIRKASIARTKKKSGTNALSDKELQQYANRLQLEQNVKRLESSSKSPGRRFVTNLLANTGKNAAQTAANEITTKQVKKLMGSEGKKK